jgi:hypothetical protein
VAGKFACIRARHLSHFSLTTKMKAPPAMNL